MKWIYFCINNKLIVYILTIAICAIGIFSLYLSPVEPFPRITFGNLKIHVSYPGASAKTVQTQVTNKIVNALKSTNNIQQIIAYSSPGSAQLKIHMTSSTPSDMLGTKLNVMQAIMSSRLPMSVPMPTISDDKASSSIVMFLVYSQDWSVFRIQNFIQAKLYPKFKSLPGVSLDFFNGDPAVKIQLNPEKIAKYNLNTTAITNLINQSFQAEPVGNLYLGQEAYTLGMNKNITSLSDFRDLIIGYSSKTGYPIRLKDVAKINFGSKNIIAKHYESLNGQQYSNITLKTEGYSNPFSVWRNASSYVNSIKSSLPSHTKIVSVFNNAKTMENAVNEVIWAIIFASCLVLVIALAFLGHLKTALIPIITIPICLLGSIAIINSLGYSINVLTLLAFVVAVGLVVDDAIVVIENINRYIERGYEKHDAVIYGTQNIAKTIISITLVLMAVFIPITFCHGFFIELLKAFAIPLAATVFISGILALTLCPILTIALLSIKQTNYQKNFNTLLNQIISFYQKLLKTVLKTPKRFIIVIICILGITGYFDLKIPQEVFPVDPDGQVNIITQSNSTTKISTLKANSTLFKKFCDGPEVKYYSVNISPDELTGRTQTTVSILYKKEYLHRVLDYAKKINHFIKKHRIANTIVTVDKMSSTGSNIDLEFFLFGPKSIKSVNNLANQLTQLMKKTSIFSSVYNTINIPQKHLNFIINSPKAASVGIFRPQILQLLSIYYGGYTLANNFNINGITVPVIVQLNSSNLKTEKSLNNLKIHSSITGKSYSLNNFVSLKTVAEPNQITTFNGQPAVEIAANLVKGKSLNKAIGLVNNLIAKNMPDMQHAYIKNALRFIKGSNQSIIIIVLAILSIYCLLVILFKSLVDPFIIMLTVPFTVVGGITSLYLVNGTLNLYSALALITLIGLITKHGILIVQFANHEMAQDKNAKDAILTATKQRFRPIIMTTLAMSLGILPLVFSSDKLFVAKQDLGIVIMGGVLIGTLFSLFIVPTVYYLIKTGKESTLKCKS